MNKAFLSFFMIFTVLLSSISYADAIFGDADDVSIDRVKVNGKAVSDGRTNFIDEADEFDITAELTATEDISNMHVEALLTDMSTGNTLSDSTGTFDLKTNQSTLVALSLQLISVLKKQNDFRLVVRVVDVDGDREERSYGLRLTGAGAGGKREELDVSIDSVEIEGDALAENENNFVIIDKGEKKLNLKARLTSLENVEDAHIDAVLAFENGDVVADATTTFDIGDGENLVKDLSLPLIGRFEQNSFRLKVKVTDAEGDSEEKLYGLKLSQNKFPFVVSSILLPETNIEAGKSMVARINFRNSGVVPLEGISASASIPELGISSTKFIDNAKNSKAEIREEFILRIPENIPTGTYTLRSEIGSQFGGDKEIKELPVFITGKDEQNRQAVNDRLVVNIPITSQTIYNDGSEAIYPVILTNEGPGANTYSLSLDGANWAKLRLSEPNVLIIEPGESKTINVIASSDGNAIGEQIFLVAIKSDGKVLRQIVLKGNVIAAKGLLAAKLKSILEIMLIGLVVLLIAIGLFFGIKKYIIGNGNSGNAEEIPNQEQGEAYY
ncbi:hypothetical protein HYX08_01325 [Candidatus Woesearchaeota archaeon]|nr:hypothetical protein [Candidatus Woesearchaeota archaeon]